MVKLKCKSLSRKLRKQGKSIKEIAILIKVSPASVSNWCKDIKLTIEQQEFLEKRRIDPNYGNKKAYLLKRKNTFNNLLNVLRKSGVKEVGKLSKREIFLIGIALYWGEGFKKDHQVGLANIDSKLIRFYIYWLKKCFDIDNKDLILRVTANISYKDKVDELEKFWSKELNIPQAQFSKPFFQNTVWKKDYANKECYHGVLRVKVRKSVNLLRKIYGFIDGLYLNIN